MKFEDLPPEIQAWIEEEISEWSLAVADIAVTIVLRISLTEMYARTRTGYEAAYARWKITEAALNREIEALRQCVDNHIDKDTNL